MPSVAALNYPSLNEVANLVRSIVNDDKRGATGTPGEGWNLTNTSVQLQNFMNSAIRDLYNDIRIVGQQTLIKDNYILSGLPPVNSPLGVGNPNPAVQTSLSFLGYFDGFQYWNTLDYGWTLPSDLLFPLEVWSRPSNLSLQFTKMREVPGSLGSCIQNQYLTQWEWRTDAIWMNGATIPYDLRLRYEVIYQNLVSMNIDWNYTYVPVMNCQELLAWKVAVLYASRLGGGNLANAMLQEKSARLKLQQQTIRNRQNIDYRTPLYRPNAGSEGNFNNILY